MRGPLATIRSALVARADRSLSTELEVSGAIVSKDPEAIRRVIRKGDVILVEGRERLSQLIQLFTLSTWSHSALYVGDAALKRDPARRDRLVDEFGDQADKLIVEALVRDGVVLSPLEKYRDHNLRICRPRDLSAHSLDLVLDLALRDLGKQYDRRNIVHLMLQLLPFRLGPFKRLSTEICIGACSEFQVICSGSIARAFHAAGIVVRPALGRAATRRRGARTNTEPASLGSDHPSWVTPRDFDLSPSFEIVNVEAGE